MDALTRKFDAFRNDPSVGQAVKYGIRRGQAVLNKYYGKTDESVVYRVALLLHPGYRVAYLREQGWPEAWITEAKKLGRDMWKTFYLTPEGGDKGKKGVKPPSSSLYDDLDGILAQSSQVPASVGQAFDTFVDPPRTDLSIAPFHGQALAWWNVQTSMDGLKHMAFDVLGTPAMSVEVERAFSKAGLVVSARRTKLSLDSTAAQMIVGDWAGRGILSESAFVNANQVASTSASSSRQVIGIEDDSDDEVYS